MSDFEKGYKRELSKSEQIRLESSYMARAKALFPKNLTAFNYWAERIAGCKTAEDFEQVSSDLLISEQKRKK